MVALLVLTLLQTPGQKLDTEDAKLLVYDSARGLTLKVRTDGRVDLTVTEEDKETGKKTAKTVSESGADEFRDQLVTWRELGFNFCSKRPDYDQFSSLPAWCRTTLSEHEGDPRTPRYSLAEFEAAATHDPLWNAAQTQLAREGRIHNYLRMLWGKKILEWTAHPREALAVMLELNNRYALDGRDPNSSSGICWCLGRFDRPWAPQRPVFGRIRFMSSASGIAPRSSVRREDSAPP